VPIFSYGWPLWRPPTAKHWSRLESVVCLPLRCCVGLPISAEKLALFVEFGIVRPQLWHGCCAITFAHRVDTQLTNINAQHPAHRVFLAQKASRLQRKCPKHRIPLAKAVQTVEWQLGVNHDSSNVTVAVLRKLALAKQIRQIRAPKETHKPSRYATEYTFGPAPTSYIMLDSRDNAILRARMRLNRHHLRQRQHKLGLADSPWCPSCPHREENIQHVLFDCPRLQLARMQLTQELALFGESPDLSVITGDLARVRPAHVAGVLAATATFLSRINQTVSI